MTKSEMQQASAEEIQARLALYGERMYELARYSGFPAFYYEAAKVGHAAAQAEMAGHNQRYAYWPSLVKNEEERRMWLRKAAANGDAWAQWIMADTCRNSGDDAQARCWLERAAAGGWPKAQYRLGRLLQEEGDVAGARDWFIRAGTKRGEAGFYPLRDLYVNTGDVAALQEWFAKEEEAGNKKVLYCLACDMARAGDAAAAREYIERAAVNGNKKAVAAILRGFREEGKSAEAVNWYRGIMADSVAAHAELAGLLIEDGREEEALEMLSPWADGNLPPETPARWGIPVALTEEEGSTERIREESDTDEEEAAVPYLAGNCDPPQWGIPWQPDGGKQRSGKRKKWPAGKSR